jgi:tRNA U34 5-methylaminomethyl-2-thiouridine-forming methyltransferase MnmC
VQIKAISTKFESLKIYPTKTGENTLYLPDMDETYHSRNGAISEAMHVFIKEGFNRVTSPSKTLNILEIGFGTGLNALVTAIEAEKQKQKTVYASLEPYPITKELITQLNYGNFLNNTSLFNSIHQAKWNIETKVSAYFNLIKRSQKLEETTLNKLSYDLIYFDAFAPKKQPELWIKDIFAMLHNALDANGILVTYSASGQLKRDLKSLGFMLEHPPGANGKREMTVAIKC